MLSSDEVVTCNMRFMWMKYVFANVCWVLINLCHFMSAVCMIGAWYFVSLFYVYLQCDALENYSILHFHLNTVTRLKILLTNVTQICQNVDLMVKILYMSEVLILHQNLSCERNPLYTYHWMQKGNKRNFITFTIPILVGNWTYIYQQT